MNTGGRNDRMRVLYDFKDFHFKESDACEPVEERSTPRKDIDFESVYSYSARTSPDDDHAEPVRT